MFNNVEADILEFLNRPGKENSTMADICKEFPKRNPDVIKASVKALVESGDIWSEGLPLRYKNISPGIDKN